MTAPNPDFSQLMALEPHGPDVFIGISPEYEWGRLYGGQVVAQALRAAISTVDPGFSVHSLHCYFLRGGTFTEPVRYEVDRIRNGRSFQTRLVVARQSGGAILNLSSSFQTCEPAPAVQVSHMPLNLPEPLSLEPVGWGFLADRRMISTRPGSGRSMGWVRIVDPIGDDAALHACGLAFTSDMVQFQAARDLHPRQVPESMYREVFMGASLDHAVWFHRPMRADDWHLYEVAAHQLGGARGLTIGNVFSPDGTHVASMTQEVLLRERHDAPDTPPPS